MVTSINLAESFLVNRYLSELVNIESVVSDYKVSSIRDATDITGLISGFSPSGTFPADILDFQGRSNQFIFQVEDKVGSGSPGFFTDLKSFIINCTFINSDSELMNALNLPLFPTPADLLNLVRFNTLFIEQFLGSILFGIMEAIRTVFNSDEFQLATRMAALIINAIGSGLAALMGLMNNALNAIRNCLTASVTLLSKIADIESNVFGMLSSMHYTNAGIFDYTILNGLSAGNITNITNATFASRLVMNNSITNMAQAIGQEREDSRYLIENPLVV